MAPAAPPQSQQQGDNSLAALWLTLFFFLLLGTIWYLFHPQIVWFVLKIKYYEAAFMSIFTSKTVSLTQQLAHFNPAGISVSSFYSVASTVGLYFRYPVILLFILLAAVIYYGHPTLRFKRTHNMKTLYEQEKFNWPQIIPVSTINLVKEHVEKGPWAMCLTPLQFAKKYKLLVEEREKKNAIGASRVAVSVSLLRSEAYQVFSTQLGGYFMGVDKLNMHTKALFAVFAARVNREDEGARKILDQLAISSISGHLNFSGVEELAKKHKNSPLVKSIFEKHAYIPTIMATMLEIARQDGVLATADFLWLKLVDRSLWFMLNSVGRQTAFPEVAGAFAHWLAEKKLGKKINVPMVEEAVKALDFAIKDVIYVPDQEGQR